MRAKRTILAIAAAVMAVAGLAGPASADVSDGKIQDTFKSSGWYDRADPGVDDFQGLDYQYRQFPIACQDPNTPQAAWTALWVYPNERASTLAAVPGEARTALRRASSIFGASARRTYVPDGNFATGEAAFRGSSLTPRWTTNSACAITIQPVGVPASVINSNAGYDLIAYLRSLGFTQNNRKYAVLVATTPTGAPPAGSIVPGGYSDGSDDPSIDPSVNGSNRTGIAITFRSSWDYGGGAGHTIAHEMTHNMGAVISSAPRHNPQNGAHASDCNDVMCYPAGRASGQTYRNGCGTSGEIEYAINRRFNDRLDCGMNDYFNPYPASGPQWQNTRWGVSLSSFLYGSGSSYASANPATSRSADSREDEYPRKIIVD